MNTEKSPSNSDVLLMTQYPIIDHLRDDIHEAVGKNVDFVVVSTLVADGYIQLLSSLRKKHYSRLYLYIADETALPLAAVLKVLSFAVPAGSRFLMMPKRSAASYSMIDGVLGAMSIAASVIQGGVAMISIGVRAKYLNFADRVRLPNAPVAQDIRDFAYIKTTLWLGVQAGGALTHTWGVVGGLLRRSAKVRYLSADAQGHRGEDNFVHIPIKPENPYVIPRELNHFLYHRAFYRSALRNLAGFSGAIYQRISTGNFVGVELSRRYGMPLIIEYNGSESWLARNWGTPFVFPAIVALIEEVSLRHAHVVTTVSEPLKRELMERGVAERRIVVHPNGVDPSAFDPSKFSTDTISAVREGLGVPQDAILISFVGTFGPWHGAEQLARAARRLIKEQRDGDSGNQYFLFIGDGARRSEVEFFAGELIDHGRVILTGLVNPEDIPSYLAASDILVSPTVQNPDKTPFFGSPTKLFEYMAAGKPIVASKIGQIEEIMSGSNLVADLETVSAEDDVSKDGKIGILTMPGNVGDLCEAIQFLTANPRLRKAWGAAARRRVLERYTWDHHVDAVIEKLDDVLAAEKARPTRVLINGLHSKSGGGVTYLRNMLPILQRNKKLDIHLYLNTAQVPLFEQYLGDVTLHIVDLGDSLWRLLFFEQLKLPRLARRMKAEVVFSPANYGPLLSSRTVILLRNAMSVAFVERRLNKILYWLLLYIGTMVSIVRARRVVSVSTYAQKSTIGSTLGSSANKFQTVPHGISSSFAVDSAIQRDQNTLLCVSDIYVQKNLHTFFEALPEICASFPDLKVRIAGAPVDQDYNAHLQKRLRGLGLSDHVEFMGNLDSHELKNNYQQASLFIFPSTVETFGNPLVEAMACGAPVVSSNTAAMPEVAGDAAAYFDPHDAHDMARVIIELLHNPERRDELGRLGLARAKIYSWEETARKMADVFIEVARD